MADLDELYQYVILDHNNNPRNFKKLDKANRTADGYNPICGDKITLFLQLANGSSPGETVITDVGFLGSGCAISKASASMMTQSIKGKSQVEVEGLFSAFRSMITGLGANSGPKLASENVTSARMDRANTGTTTCSQNSVRMNPSAKSNRWIRTRSSTGSNWKC